MAGWLILMVLGPAQTIAGKYVPGEPVATTTGLPADVAALCVVVEGGGGTAEVYAALGAALLHRGDKALADFDGDRGIFYERYGRSEDDLWEFTRRRRFSGVGGFAVLLLGSAFAAAARHVSKRAALLPVLLGALCLFGPLWAEQVGLLYWGAGFAFGGAGIVLARGR